MDIKQKIKNWVDNKVDAVGFAPIDRFAEAPENHHPERMLRGARTVIVYGRLIPRGVTRSPDYGKYFLHRSYHTVYPYLDELGYSLSNYLEAETGELAVQAPSYLPMVFHDREPWGVLSLKHAAEKAGLGAFGRSGQLYHPKYGALLRLGAVITTAEIEGDPLMDDMPCPEDCTACMKACPVHAIKQTREQFEKMTCLAYAIKHAIYPLALGTEEGIKRIERVINTAGYDYWLECFSCVKVCPLNQRPSVEPVL